MMRRYEIIKAFHSLSVFVGWRGVPELTCRFYTSKSFLESGAHLVVLSDWNSDERIVLVPNGTIAVVSRYFCERDGALP